MKLDFSSIKNHLYDIDEKSYNDHEKGIDVKSDEYMSKTIENAYKHFRKDEDDVKDFFRDNFHLFWNNISDEEYKEMCQNFVNHLYEDGNIEELTDWIMQEYGKDKIFKDYGYEEAAIDYITEYTDDAIDSSVKDVDLSKEIEKM